MCHAPLPTSSPQSVVEIERLSHSYGQRAALVDVAAPATVRFNLHGQEGSDVRILHLLNYAASPAAEVKFSQFIMSDLKDNFLVKRLGCFADCNLLDGVPKVNGFFLGSAFMR